MTVGGNLYRVAVAWAGGAATGPGRTAAESPVPEGATRPRNYLNTSLTRIF